MLWREMRRSVELILNGLKHHIERGEAVGSKLPPAAHRAATVREHVLAAGAAHDRLLSEPSQESMP